MPGNKKQWLILLDRDTGDHILTEARPPLEAIPLGYHALPWTGSRSHMARIARRLNKRPFLTAKYSVL